MKIEHITVGYGRTFKTGDYESIRLDCQIEATVDDGEDPGPARTALQAMAREAVRDEYLQYQKAQADRKAGKPPATVSDGAVPPRSVEDAAFRKKVEASEQGPSIVKPAQGGAGTAKVKSGPVTGDIDKDGY